MPPKTTQSLDDLRSHARLSYRYWPIYLYLRLREVEQHLTDAERAELGETKPKLQARTSNLDLSILIEYGLWSEDEIVPEVDEPTYNELAVAEQYMFRVGASLTIKGFSQDFYSLNLVAILTEQVLHLELLRVRNTDAQTLSTSGKLFNRIADEISPQVAYESAQLWAALHGARSLNWLPVPNQMLRDFIPELFIVSSSQSSQNGKQRFLPPRKRGKGMFRDPN
jgi:hypothetical protein